jgi:hypothetical protein
MEQNYSLTNKDEIPDLNDRKNESPEAEKGQVSRRGLLKIALIAIPGVSLLSTLPSKANAQDTTNPNTHVDTHGDHTDSM